MTDIDGLLVTPLRRIPDERGAVLHMLRRLTGDEVFFTAEWNDEFEPYPARVAGDLLDFREGLPLGLEDWMLEAQCVLALGDGGGLNYATPSLELHERLAGRFKPARK